jgi:peptidoglycan/LPS O-acetylase OafA/YrhL
MAGQEPKWKSPRSEISRNARSRHTRAAAGASARYFGDLELPRPASAAADLFPPPRRAVRHQRSEQLDAIRALAVALVVFEHTTRPTALLTRDAGAIGVVVFFVLSGFLITGILLDARDDADASGVERGGVLRRFYARRFVRIFPLYYAVVAAAWVIGDWSVRKHILWLLTYTTNFVMAHLGRNIGIATPFWSLAIEEQFYLFWPCIVLFMPRRRLPFIITAMIVVSVGTRFIVARTGAPEHTVTMPTWSSLDGLAIGAALALAHRGSRDPSRAMRWVLGGGIALAALRLGLMEIGRGRSVWLALWMLPWAMIAAWAVDQGARDRLPQVFRWRPLLWMGITSYGTYVYHRPIMALLHIPSNGGAGAFALATGVSVAVASASWIFFERPINNLKRRWPYVPAARGRASLGPGGLAPRTGEAPAI